MKKEKVIRVSMERIAELLGGCNDANGEIIIRREVGYSSIVPLNTPFQAEACGIVLCKRGKICLSVDAGKQTLTENSVVLYGISHIFNVESMSSDLLLDVIIMSPDMATLILADVNVMMPLYRYSANDRRDAMVMDPEEIKMTENFVSLIDNVAPIDNSSIMRHLLSAFSRTIGEMYSKRQSGAFGSKSRHEEYFENFIAAVYKYHKEQRSVQFYADKLHITPKYLSAVIKQFSGKSALEWIDDFVIQQAKTMLRFSKKSIQEITYSLNFSTQSFFGKYFKRHTGMSPSKYRLSE